MPKAPVKPALKKPVASAPSKPLPKKPAVAPPTRPVAKPATVSKPVAAKPAVTAKVAPKAAPPTGKTPTPVAQARPSTPASRPVASKPNAPKKVAKAADASILKRGTQAGMVFDARGSIKSAKGVAAFPFLSRPDTYDADNPVFKITLTFSMSDEESQAMYQKICEFNAAFLADAGYESDGPPSCVKIAEDGESFDITFKAKAKTNEDGSWIPIDVVGRNAKPTTEYVRSDDVVRVVFSLVGYEYKGKVGVRCVLSAVQLLEMLGDRTGSSRGASMFSAEDGEGDEGLIDESQELVDEGTEDAVEEEAVEGDEQGQIDEDDIPF